jgi:hypothetical protein
MFKGVLIIYAKICVGKTLFWRIVYRENSKNV